MRIPFYKSLDREFELFGVKGKWVFIVLIGSGAGALLGLIFGAVAGTVVGVITFVLLMAVSFFGSITMQTKIPSRQLPKVRLVTKMSSWTVRRETLHRILLEDNRYVKFRKEFDIASRNARQKEGKED